MANQFAMPPEIQYVQTPSFKSPLTAAEKAELAQLENEFSQPAGLSAAEEQELAQLEVEQSTEKPDVTAGMIGKFTNGMTFDGGDEIQAGLFAAPRALGNLISGKDDASIGGAYDQLLSEQRRNLDAAEKEHPVASTALELAGALGTGVAGAGTKLGKFIGSKAAKGFAPAATSAAGKAGNLISRMGVGGAAAATGGAAYGFGGGEGVEGRLDEAKTLGMVGGAVGAGLPLAGAGLGALGGAIAPKVSRSSAELAKRARELEIPLSVSQIAPSRARNTIQKVSQELPFSGVDGFEDIATKKYTRALARTLGQDADDLSPSTIQAFSSSNSAKFDDALKGQSFDFDKAQLDSIRNIAGEASEALSADLQPTVAKNISVALDTIKGGKINGEQLASLRSRLLRNSSSAKNQTSPYINDIVSKIDDVIEQNLPKDRLSALQAARKEYRNFKTLQPLLEKSTDGIVKPTDLLNRVAANKYIDTAKIPTGQDELVDLARIGKEFLPKLGGSDSAQKIGAAVAGKTALTGAAALGDLGITAAALGGNKLFQKGYNQNQRLVDALLKKTAKLEPVAKSSPRSEKQVGALLDALNKTGSN